MSPVKRVTAEDVAEATARFKAQGGEIDRTVVFPKIDKKRKSYGQLANERQTRRNKRRQQSRDQEKEARGLS